MNQPKKQKSETVQVLNEAEKSEVALREEAIQRFWEEHDVFKQSLEKPGGGEPNGDYVFYDGPPFATGLPHYGHLLAGTIKDAVPRFWTMRGYRVRRRWGWDCHGLPLENLIEKQLGLATKRDIEEYGIQNFNEAARAAVMEYADEWRQIVPRMGRFVDMHDDYKTMDSAYTESVWWVFKTLHEKGLVYEGFKSMHLCPRCGTTLSNFEVNQGYKDIKDIAVTVKLPLLDDDGDPTDTSLLVWTTTPWTLPGNLAAAVHRDYEYVKAQVMPQLQKDGSETPHRGEYVILAKEILTKKQLSGLGEDVYGFGEHHLRIVETFKGADLLGKHYLPPFNYLYQEWSPKESAVTPQPIDFPFNTSNWQIYHADYVELGEEGTGAVHLAPAYGEEDLELAVLQGIEIVHHVDEGGHFKDFITDFAGLLVKPKDDPNAEVSHLDADIEITKALKASGTLFKKENITHSYPHCWRCDTPLLNYATTSWFVRVTDIREQLVAENQEVHWVPEHVGHNRFGRWLEGARDWAVSRQRYWGAPLPIWRNPTTGAYQVFGSLAKLQEYVPKSGNTYHLMRHGESESNVAGKISARTENADGITETGREQVRAAAETVPTVDIIIHSGFQRTRETAELVAAELGGSVEVLEDPRIGEMQVGPDYEGGKWSDFNGEFTSWIDRFHEHPVAGAENRRDVQVRMGQFLFDLEARYQGKRILIVSHAGALFALESAARGWTPEDALAHHDATDDTIYFTNAEVRTLDFTPYPHNDNFELDFHRPYIDRIPLQDTDGTTLERVPDVFDCWFESGAMPYGQHHYPFAIDDATFQREYYPANFIAESIDQTRGWFYSLMVLGVALFGKSPYQNVVTNGLVLAEDGRKMSKSLQNYPDPMALVARQGADSMRFYLLSSSIIKGEDLNFSEKEVQELQRKNLGRLHNVLTMYETYADGTASSDASEHVLDRWIISRCNELIIESTAGFAAYELDKATRPITDFIDDLSVWYLRRSRDRLKSEDDADKQAALATLRYTLKTLALVMAPSMPFYAEHLYRAVRTETDPESVHLAAWPEAGEPDPVVLRAMRETREIVTKALEARTRAGIKVRQPLTRLTVAGAEPLPAAYAAIVCDEVNVKALEQTDTENGELGAELDTTITPELAREGAAREFMRAVQERRKAEGLAPHDRVSVAVATNEAGQAVLATFADEIKKTTGADSLNIVDTCADGGAVTVGEYAFTFAITQN